ncbi:MAG: hypothetical protein SPI47_03700 [Lentihominibacter sp.]|nr:hypothetical protein [Lentihominibacter sp.]
MSRQRLTAMVGNAPTEVAGRYRREESIYFDRKETGGRYVR